MSQRNIDRTLTAAIADTRVGAQQRSKLQAALAVFAREGVRADAWVAPAHSCERRRERASNRSV